MISWLYYTFSNLVSVLLRVWLVCDVILHLPRVFSYKGVSPPLTYNVNLFRAWELKLLLHFDNGACNRKMDAIPRQISNSFGQC